MVENTGQEEKAIRRVLQAISEIKAGGMVIMTDDEDRENEGDLILAASEVCPEKVNFMAKEARGLICLTLEAEKVDALQLPMMRSHMNGETPMETAFTVSIEARNGVTTGISAADRAHTIKVAIDEKTRPEDLVVPGHVFPLKARKGGVLERAGHTEGSVDLARLAGKAPAAVICEIMNDDGTMARLPDLEKFAQKFNIPLVSIADLIVYRLLRETLVEEMIRKPFETPQGRFTGVWFRNLVDRNVHFALINQESFESGQCVDVRVQKQNPLGDVFGSGDANQNDLIDSRWAVDYSLNLLKTKKAAAVLYLSQPSQQDAMLDALEGRQSPMDPRLYGVGAQMIRSLGIDTMNLHVRSEKTLKGLHGFGIEIRSMEVMKG